MSASGPFGLVIIDARWAKAVIGRPPWRAAGDRAGALVAIDPSNGEILALARTERRGAKATDVLIVATAASTARS